ncbi:dual oxidase maturation factor 2 isoform X2 [Lathamus discolor]|uniref:dual oxidase maturation factor 2 isoform X2 n=1 Tax=Lathamus discolor TaxID=678569 RepID=UPI0032B7896B
MTLIDGVYPFYLQQRKVSVFDVSTIIVIVVFLTFACSFLLIIPGIRGRVRLYWTLRVLFSLIMGVVIVTVQFTGDWETGWVRANTSYKSFSPGLVSADIGLHIGLAGVNISLRGNPVNQVNETIDYNEHFPWSFSADYDQSYSQGLERGLPRPILYVAEKFTTRSPCSMQRQYRISSHYASATLCLWRLHAPRHRGLHDLFAAVILHCEKLPDVPDPVWSCDPAHRLWRILLDHAGDWLALFCGWDQCCHTALLQLGLPENFL